MVNDLKTGFGYKAGFAEEPTWGTGVATPANFLTNPTDTLKGMVDLIEAEGDLAYPALPSHGAAPGQELVEGGITLDPQFGGGWMVFLAHLTGVDVITAGTGPYTHTLGIGKTLGGADDLTGRGISIIIDREGERADANATAEHFIGYRPNSIELAFEYNRRCKMSVEGVGRTVARAARPSLALPTEPFIVSPSSRPTPTSFFQWGGTAYLASSGNLTIAREADVRRRVEAAQSPGIMPGGLMEVSGTLEVEAPDTGATSGGVWIDDYRSKVARPLILTLDGPTANHGIVLTVHAARLTSPGDPEVTSPGVIRQTIEWKGYFSAADAEIASFVLTTDDTKAWN